MINILCSRGIATCDGCQIVDKCELIELTEDVNPYALYEQGRADATRWIPCERLPEENGYYITTTQYNEVYCDYFDGEKFSRTEFVIAWMPLPEPYREEK